MNKMDEPQNHFANRNQTDRKDYMLYDFQSVQKRQIYGDRNQISGYLGVVGVRVMVDIHSHGRRVWGDGNVLKLDRGGYCTTPHIY